MRVLLIKMSSMGDVFHTFPALSDAQANIPNLTIDWVVEKGFSDIASWHKVVDKVYPIELRKWRKTPFNKQTKAEVKAFFEQVNQTQYDLVIDAQGLLKSIWVARKINAPTAGYNWSSARESLASLFYKHKAQVNTDQHAILRIRQLFAKSLGYSLADNAPIVYGLATESWSRPNQVVSSFADDDYWVCLHGTTWDTKYWPEDYWTKLIAQKLSDGIQIMLPWGNDEERQRALRLAEKALQQSIDLANEQGGQANPIAKVYVPEEMLSLNDMAKALKNAQAVVSVDTGLSHVTAALEVPMVVMYRVTDPKLVGADGEKVIRLASPCAPKYLKKFEYPEQEFESLQGLSVDDVLQAINSLLPNKQCDKGS